MPRPRAGPSSPGTPSLLYSIAPGMGLLGVHGPVQSRAPAVSGHPSLLWSTQRDTLHTHELLAVYDKADSVSEV